MAVDSVVRRSPHLTRLPLQAITSGLSITAINVAALSVLLAVATEETLQAISATLSPRT